MNCFLHFWEDGIEGLFSLSLPPSSIQSPGHDVKQDSKGGEKEVWRETWNPMNDKVASSLGFLRALPVPDLGLEKQQSQYANAHRRIQPALVKGE